MIKDLSLNDQVERRYTFGDYLNVKLKDDNESDETELKSYGEQPEHSHFEVKRIEPGIEDSFIRLISKRIES